MRKINVKVLALSSVLCAFSIICLYLACILPGGQLALCALAGILPAASLLSGGMLYGVMTFAATALLAFPLMPDPSVTLTYVLIFGYYPMLKSAIERIGRLFWEWALKLLFLNALMCALFFMMKSLFIAYLELPGFGFPVILLILNAVFVIYDISFSKLIWLMGRYLHKFRLM